jgi:hypothetical protein
MGFELLLGELDPWSLGTALFLPTHFESWLGRRRCLRIHTRIPSPLFVFSHYSQQAGVVPVDRLLWQIVMG